MPRRPYPARPPRRPRRVLAALVALCVLLSGIAPGVSHALAAAAVPALQDLCVADGPARTAAPAGHHGGAADEPACPLCGVHGATHAAPPACPGAGLAPSDAAASPARADARRAARAGWIAAAPRGPPGSLRSA